MPAKHSRPTKASVTPGAKAEAVLGEPPSDLDDKNAGEIRRLRQDLQAAQAELEQLKNQVFEQSAKLREPERMVQAIIDGLKANIAIVDEQGLILSVNQGWRDFASQDGKVLGACCEGAKYLEAWCAAGGQKDVAMAAGLLDVLAGRRREFALEYPCHFPQVERWFMARVSALPGDGPRGAVITHEEITMQGTEEREIQKKEAQLHGVDRRLADILQGMTEACFSLDKNWRFTFANERCQTLFHHREDEMLGRFIWEVFPWFAGTPKEQHFCRAMAERIPVAFEAFSHVAERWLDIRLFPTPEGLAAFLLDIQERKLADEELRKSEEQYRNLFTSMLEGFCIIEVIFDKDLHPLDYRFIETNPAFEKQTGLSEAQGKLMRDLAPEHEAHWFEMYGKVALTGEPVRFVSEARALRRWYEVAAFRLGGAESRRVAILFNDITEAKRAAEALHASVRRESERAAELEALLDAVPAAVLISHDPAARHITGNRAADALLRLPRGGEASLDASDETKPRHFKAFKDGRELTTDELPSQRASRGEPVSDFEFSVVFDDGTRRDMLACGTPLRNADGLPRGAVCVLMDITERLRAQEALRAREAQLHSFVQQAPVSIAMFDRNMDCLAASQRWISAYGQGHADIVGMNHYVLHPDLPQRWKDIHRRGLAGESLFNDDDLWVKADGRKIWLRWAVRPWMDVQGSIGGLLIMAEDISDRKRAEAALHESEERYRLLADHAEDFVALYDIQGNALYVSPSFYRQTGWRSEDLHSIGARLWLFPEDLPSIERAHAANLAGEPTTIEYRIRRRDGSHLWVETRSKPLRDHDGKVWRLVLWSRDITEQKRAQDSLSENRRRLASIIDSAMDAIISVDSSLRVIVFNDAAQKMFQCRGADALGQSLDKFIPQRFREAHPGHMRRFGEGGTTKEMMGKLGTVTGLRADGEEFPLEASISHINTDGQKIYTVIMRDVGSRLRKDAALQRQAQLLHLSHDAIFVWSTKHGIEYWNQGATCLYGFDATESMGRDPKEHLRVLLHGTPWPQIERALLQEGAWEGTLRQKTKNGEDVVVAARLQMINEGPGTGMVILQSNRDITDRQRLEEALLRAGEEERQRIGRDLHDGLGQEMTGIAFLNNVLLSNLEAKGLPEVASVKRLAELVRHASGEVRRVSRGLQPVPADPASLVTSLERLISDAASMERVACEFLGSTKVCVYHSEIANHLYRIAQEAVQNAQRHGHAKHISVGLRRDGDRVVLEIQDDGTGFDPTRIQSHGMGLGSMRYRAEAMNGYLEILQPATGGALVRCCVPDPEPVKK